MHITNATSTAPEIHTIIGVEAQASDVNNVELSDVLLNTSANKVTLDLTNYAGLAGVLLKENENCDSNTTIDYTTNVLSASTTLSWNYTIVGGRKLCISNGSDFREIVMPTMPSMKTPTVWNNEGTVIGTFEPNQKFYTTGLVDCSTDVNDYTGSVGSDGFYTPTISEATKKFCYHFSKAGTPNIRVIRSMLFPVPEKIDYVSYELFRQTMFITIENKTTGVSASIIGDDKNCDVYAANISHFVSLDPNDIGYINVGPSTGLIACLTWNYAYQPIALPAPVTVNETPTAALGGSSVMGTFLPNTKYYLARDVIQCDNKVATFTETTGSDGSYTVARGADASKYVVCFMHITNATSTAPEIHTIIGVEASLDPSVEFLSVTETKLDFTTQKATLTLFGHLDGLTGKVISGDCNSSSSITSNDTLTPGVHAYSLPGRENVSLCITDGTEYRAITLDDPTTEPSLYKVATGVEGIFEPNQKYYISDSGCSTTPSNFSHALDTNGKFNLSTLGQNEIVCLMYQNNALSVFKQVQLHFNLRIDAVLFNDSSNEISVHVDGDIQAGLKGCVISMNNECADQTSLENIGNEWSTFSIKPESNLVVCLWKDNTYERIPLSNPFSPSVEPSVLRLPDGTVDGVADPNSMYYRSSSGICGSVPSLFTESVGTGNFTISAPAPAHNDVVCFIKQITTQNMNVIVVSKSSVQLSQEFNNVRVSSVEYDYNSSVQNIHVNIANDSEVLFATVVNDVTNCTKNSTVSEYTKQSPIVVSLQVTNGLILCLADNTRYTRISLPTPYSAELDSYFVADGTVIATYGTAGSLEVSSNGSDFSSVTNHEYIGDAETLYFKLNYVTNSISVTTITKKQYVVPNIPQLSLLHVDFPNDLVIDVSSDGDGMAYGILHNEKCDQDFVFSPGVSFTTPTSVAGGFRGPVKLCMQISDFEVASTTVLTPDFNIINETDMDVFVPENLPKGLVGDSPSFKITLPEGSEVFTADGTTVPLQSNDLVSVIINPNDKKSSILKLEELSPGVFSIPFEKAFDIQITYGNINVINYLSIFESLSDMMFSDGIIPGFDENNIVDDTFIGNIEEDGEGFNFPDMVPNSIIETVDIPDEEAFTYTKSCKTVSANETCVMNPSYDAITMMSETIRPQCSNNSCTFTITNTNKDLPLEPVEISVFRDNKRVTDAVVQLEAAYQKDSKHVIASNTAKLEILANKYNINAHIKDSSTVMFELPNRVLQDNETIVIEDLSFSSNNSTLNLSIPSPITITKDNFELKLTNSVNPSIIDDVSGTIKSTAVRFNTQKYTTSLTFTIFEEIAEPANNFVPYFASSIVGGSIIIGIVILWLRTKNQKHIPVCSVEELVEEVSEVVVEESDSLASPDNSLSSDVCDEDSSTQDVESSSSTEESHEISEHL